MILNQLLIKSTKRKFCLHRNIYFMHFSTIDINIEKMLETLNDRTADQLEARLVIIDAEKRRAHLRHKLAQAEAEREAGFPVAPAPEATAHII